MTGLRVGGGLVTHEARGGHTIARHVGKTAVELSQRLASDSKIKAASSFFNLKDAELAIGKALQANADDISSWLSTSSTQKTISYSFSRAIGHVVERGSNAAVSTGNFRLVLLRDASSPIGYNIFTSYPVK